MSCLKSKSEPNLSPNPLNDCEGLIDTGPVDIPLPKLGAAAGPDLEIFERGGC